MSTRFGRTHAALFVLSIALVALPLAVSDVTAQDMSSSDATPSTGGAPSSGFGAAIPYTHVPATHTGEDLLAVWHDIPAESSVQERAPMSVSLVIDVSGSMRGSKIAQARAAAVELLRGLRDGDRISVVAFASTVEVVVPTMTLDRTTRSFVEQRVQSLRAGGNTALHRGLALGLSMAASGGTDWPLRRAFLLSDGHANVGPSRPWDLAQLASTGLRAGVNVTGIGVGVDYDLDTLERIVVASAGRFYHVGHFADLPGIVGSEIAALQGTFGTEAYVEIQPGPGVTIVSGVTPGFARVGSGFRLSVGALYAGRTIQLLARVRVPTGAPGDRHVATAELVYRDAEGEVRRLSRRISVVVGEVGSDYRIHPRAFAMQTEHQAGRHGDRALEALSRGDSSEAAANLEAAAAELEREARRVQDRPTRARMRRRARTYRSSASSARSATSGSRRRDVRGTVRQQSLRDSPY